MCHFIVGASAAFPAHPAHPCFARRCRESLTASNISNMRSACMNLVPLLAGCKQHQCNTKTQQRTQVANYTNGSKWFHLQQQHNT
eukprot:scaffold118155_cov19-Tisochrysis_lutea.AAC.2